MKFTRLNFYLILLFTALLAVDVLTMMAEKIAATASGQAVGDEMQFYMRLLKQPWMWLGVGLGPLQLFFWSKILKKSDLSLAYCITSLAYPLTMVAAAIFLAERHNFWLWLGAVLVTAGTAIISSGKEEPAAREEPKKQMVKAH